jgi:hypothetical protein
MRGPNDGTGTSSDHASTNSTTWRWQIMQLTDNERTPLARMLPSAHIREISLGHQSVLRSMESLACPSPAE